MKDRIKKIRVDAKMTQEEFGAAIGATRGMVTTYEKGTVPTLSTRMLICQKFHVSETWLETGEGSPYKDGLVYSLTHALMRMPSVCATLERILPELTDDDLDRIDELAELIKEKFGE